MASAANQLTNTSTLSFGGSTYAYFSLPASQTIAGLNAVNTGGLQAVVQVNRTTDNTNYGNQTLTLGGSGTYSYAGTIRNTDGGTSTDKLALVMNGTGTQTLSGADSYTGGTTVNSGTLVLNGNLTQAASVGAITLGGGTLDLFSAVTNRSDTIRRSP